MPISNAKNDLRHTMRRRRQREARGLGIEAAAQMRDHFLGALDPAPGLVIAAYWPLAGEMDTRPLLDALHARGCQCALPVVMGPDRALIFHRWRPGDRLVPGPHGIDEPGSECDELKPDIIALPLLAVDQQGHRLGAGGGYYDRTLSELRGQTGSAHVVPLAVGIAFSFQVLDMVPYDAFDQPLDWVVTEGDAIDFG